MSDNQVTLTGNLTDDPELRFTPNGVAVANFRLAVDQRVWDADGWKDGEASYFRGERLARPGRAHQPQPAQGGPVRGRGPAQEPLLGDPGGPAALGRRGRRRGGGHEHAVRAGRPPPAEAAKEAPTRRPAPAKAGNGSRRRRQPAKAAAGANEAPF